jgi:hypothetical protein
VDTNQKQQVVDTAKILPVVGEKRVVDISEVVDKLEKSEVSTTNENEVNEKDVSTTTDANSQVVDNSANVVDCQQCPQLESEREKSREEIEQLKTSIEQ